MTGPTHRLLGADTAALDEVASALRAGAALVAPTGWWRPGPLTWDGPDARSTATLLSDVAVQRRRAAELLDRCAAALTTAAREQRRASLAEPERVVAVDLPRDGGRLVQRVGRADAEVVVVLVPGVGTDRTDRARLVADAERVWRAAVDHVDDAAAVAVVSWLGYDPPDRVVQAVDAAPADEGAGLLARELRRLRRRGARRVAVVGHSYGGVVAGRAAGPGGADVVVQLGAPGVGEPGGVDVLAAAGVRLVAVRAVGDPIGVVAGRAPGLYGEDPVGAVPGLPTSRSGHSAYLRDPVLLDALGGLVVGSSAPPTRPLGSPSVG